MAASQQDDAGASQPTGKAVLAWVSAHSTEVVHLTPWQEELVEQWFTQIQQGAVEAREAIRQLHDQLGRARARYVALVHAFSAGPEDEVDGPPTDPMERALWLRRHRNTGPQPRRRAPRSIPPRGAR